MPDEKDVVFEEECFVAFRLTLSSNRGKRALKKGQCLNQMVVNDYGNMIGGTIAYWVWSVQSISR